MFRTNKLTKKASNELVKKAYLKWSKIQAKTLFYESMTLASKQVNKESGASILQIRDLFLSKEANYWDNEKCYWEWVPENLVLK